MILTQKNKTERSTNTHGHYNTDLDTFSAFEEAVHGLTDQMAAKFPGRALTNADFLIRLPDRERLTPIAAAKLLNEAEAHSYQHAAGSIRTKGQTVTKTTVMNKVHGVEKEIPEMKESLLEKKACWKKSTNTSGGITMRVP